MISNDDLYRHLIVFGSTGCGKTRHVILPLLERILRENADDPEMRSGALVFDVKGDMEHHLLDAMAAAGRTDPILKIGRNGNACIDPLEGIENSRSIAERIVEIVRSIHANRVGGNYDDFWLENLKRLLAVCAVLSKIQACGDSGGLAGIAEALQKILALPNQDEEKEKILNGWSQQVYGAESSGWISHEDGSMARSYLMADLQRLAENTASIIFNYGKTYLESILTNSIASILENKGKELFTPDLVIDQGRVALVSLSRVHYGPEAEIFRTMVKSSFQSCALQRFARSHFDGEKVRPINRTRPAFLVADEFPAILSPGHADDGDSFFFDKAREVKVGCILSAQGISAIDARMGDRSRTTHLLNNTCTKIFMASDCLGTLEFFERIMRDEHRPSPPMWRLPNYDFAAPNRWRPANLAPMQAGKLVEASCLRALQVGEVIIVRPGGQIEKLALPAFSLCKRG